MRVGVFGSGSCALDTEEYLAAQKLGEMLIKKGHRVITGGYGGIMEAVAKGAREAKGIPLGFTIKQKPKGNPYVKAKVVEDFFERLRELITYSEAYVFFPGGSGTAVEIFCAFHFQTIQSKLGLEIKRKPIIFVCNDKDWYKIFDSVKVFLVSEQIKMIDRVSNIEDVPELLHCLPR